MFGVLSSDGKQLFRQYNRFDSTSFLDFLKQIRKKFKKFVIFVDRATPHRSKLVSEYMQKSADSVRIEYLPVGSPQFNAVEECWRQGKYRLLSNYYSGVQHLKQVISQYYRTTKFNLNIIKYLLRSVD